jgi:hypothetical protein
MTIKNRKKQPLPIEAIKEKFTAIDMKECCAGIALVQQEGASEWWWVDLTSLIGTLTTTNTWQIAARVNDEILGIGPRFTLRLQG